MLHTVAGSKWTGAAAPALAVVEGLREEGCRAWLAFTGGNNLEARLAGAAYAAPLFGSGGGAAIRELAAVARMARRKGADVLHSHLAHDHWLAELARRRSRAGARPALVRTFHAARALKRDALHRALYRSLDGALAVHRELAAVVRDSVLPGVPVAAIPPSVDTRLFRPATAGERGAARAALGIPADAFAVGVIGKIAAGRGFPEFIDLLALMAELCGPGAPVWGVVAGKGELRLELERRARERGVAARVAWTGYLEEERLPAYYAALDAFAFLAAGSDEGHRALLEAQACGIPAAAVALPGIADVLEPRHAATAADWRQLAAPLVAWMRDVPARETAAQTAAVHASGYSVAAIAAHHSRFYRDVLAARQSAFTSTP